MTMQWSVRTRPDAPWRGRGGPVVDDIDRAVSKWDHAISQGRVTAGSPNECWLWQGSTSRGYGYMHWDTTAQRPRRKRSAPVHVIAYVATTRKLVPSGMVLDHLCDNRSCVNPAHLSVTTTRQNTLRSPVTLAAQQVSSARCKRGHDLTDPSNLVPRYLDVGKRRCATCQRLIQQAHHTLLVEARKAVGMTQREYAETYGQTRAQALAILGRSS